MHFLMTLLSFSGVLGKTNHNGAISSHHGAVTSIDANSEGLVISGGADGFVKQWEMRTLSQTVRLLKKISYLFILFVNVPP